MHITYVSSTCSPEKYAKYVERKNARVSQQAQKYNLLLAEGLAENNVDVQLVSTRPINRRISKRFWFKAERERVNGIQFSYVRFINYPLLRNITVFLSVFLKVLFMPKSRKQNVVVCDALNVMATMGALVASFFRGYVTTGIVTDVPCYFSSSKKVTFNQKLNLWLMRRFKCYLLLTDQMADIVNPKKRPYIVMEGHSDLTMTQFENKLEDKSKPRVCLYAGSLMKVYGIKTLVEGFVQADIPNVELHIYGDGDYVDELRQLVQHHDSVKYMGIAPNSEIVQAELTASLLINPRPSNEEYTKYSFPSKNMEYMASGTPVLTTRLPGMPKDHEPYVYFIEEETADGIAKALTEIFAKPSGEIHDFGMKAKSYILQEKNHVAQARKLLAMLRHAHGRKQPMEAGINNERILY